eukprot:comp8761_c0_seq1/m.3993 comp8761_c0_seq1/g.3993  ORF comp8761_c0_seq1/g.3993 comp8761_c0_seq1/m.3993 type:complete len:586 (-) comp8761_c0_seq1:111-1868(-)
MDPHHHHHHGHYHLPPHGPPHYHHHHHQHQPQPIPPTDDEFLAYDLPRLVQSLRYQRQQQQHTQQPPHWNFLNEPLADDLLFSGLTSRQAVPPLHQTNFNGWAQNQHEISHIPNFRPPHPHTQQAMGLGRMGGGPSQHPFSAGGITPAHTLGLQQNTGVFGQTPRSVLGTQGFREQELRALYAQDEGGFMNSNSGPRLTGGGARWGLGGVGQEGEQDWGDGAAAITAIRERLKRRDSDTALPTQQFQGVSKAPSNPPATQAQALNPPIIIPPTITISRRESVQQVQSRNKEPLPPPVQTPQVNKTKNSTPDRAPPAKRGKTEHGVALGQTEHAGAGAQSKSSATSHNRAISNAPDSFFKFPEPVSFNEPIVFGGALDADEPEEEGKTGKDAGTRLRAYLKSAARLRQYLYTRLSDEEIAEIESLMRPVDEIHLEAMVDLDFQELCFMEEMHLKQAEVLSKFLEMVAVPACMARRSGEILNANGAFMTMVGATKEVCETTNYFQLVHSRDLMDFSRDVLVYISKPGLPFQLIRDSTLRNLEDSREIRVRACISVHCDIYNMPALFVLLHVPFPGTPIPENTPITVY